jgi:hypothetical protein
MPISAFLLAVSALRQHNDGTTVMSTLVSPRIRGVFTALDRTAIHLSLTTEKYYTNLSISIVSETRPHSSVTSLQDPQWVRLIFHVMFFCLRSLCVSTARDVWGCRCGIKVTTDAQQDLQQTERRYENRLGTVRVSHGGDYEECRLLGEKTPVRTSQETHYVSATEPSQLILCKIWGFHSCG